MLKDRIRKWLVPERIVPLLTALTAFVADILGLFGIISITVVESLVLLAIGLLAIDALTERIQILSRIESALQRIERPPSISEDFLVSYQQLPPLRERLRSARQLWVSGTTLADLMVPNEDLFLELVMRRGLKVRFLIASLDSPFAEEIANMTYPEYGKPMESFKATLKRTIILLANLAEKAPANQVEVRCLTHYPTQSLFIVDGDSPDGEAQVHLYCRAKIPPAIFRLRASTDTHWYHVFLDEFLYLWESATPLSEVVVDESPSRRQV